MRKFILALFAAIVMVGSVGCASVAKVGKSVCDEVLGGSVAGDLCEEIDKLTDAPESDSDD